MPIQPRHYTLITGIILVILSFLFFGRLMFLYNRIILLGLGVSLISYITILYKDSRRKKLFWTLIVLLGILLQQISEPFLVRKSYSIYLRQNYEIFSRINEIFMAKSYDATWVQDSTLWKRNRITKTEGLTIRKLVDQKISFIQKDSVKIYFQTFSLWDVSLGLYYFYSSAKPAKFYRHITGKWYY